MGAYAIGVAKRPLKLHFSETQVAAYCVCSTKLLVGEMDEQMFRKLEAGKVGDVLMSLGPSLKGIRYVCAKKVWDARQTSLVLQSSSMAKTFGRSMNP